MLPPKSFDSILLERGGAAVNEGNEVVFKAGENLVAAEIVDGVATGGGAESGAKGGGIDEGADGCVEGGGVFGGDDDTAWFVDSRVATGVSTDDVGDLGSGVGGGEDGASAGEHAGEFGGHDEVGGSGTLGQEVDVGGVEQVVELVEGLEGEEGDVGEARDCGFELGAEAAVAAEEEVDLRVRGEVAGEGGEELEALLVAHVAGVEEEDFVFEASAEGVLGLSRLGVDGFDIDPVGEEDGRGRGARPWLTERSNHFGGDGGDAGEGVGEQRFELKGEGVDGAVGGEEAEVKGGVDFEVLDVEPGGGSGGVGDEEGEGGSEEGGLDGPDDLGLPEDLTEQGGEAAEGEGGEVNHALEAGGFFGDVERGAEDLWVAGLGFVGVAEVFADAPGGVVRGGGDDVEVVAPGGEPCGHFAGVFADAGELGGEVEAVDEDAEAVVSMHLAI